MTLWTPANLSPGPDLWFDANNSSSLVLSGSNVTSWTDLAHGVSTTFIIGSTNPTYTASLLNSLPGITFSGGGGLGNNSTGYANFSNDISVFAVVNITSAGYKVPLGAFGSTGPNVGFLSGSPANIATIHGGTGAQGSSTTLAFNTPAFVDWIAPGVSGGSWGPVTPYLNGTLGGSIGVLTGFSYTQIGIDIGADSDVDVTGNMNIHEIVALNVQASTANRQLIEGYLAWKWGLQANLPGGHPYQSAAPTVGGLNPFVNTWSRGWSRG